MEINKPFKDIGSIVKALMRYIDLQQYFITIGFDPNYPGVTTIKVLPHEPMRTNLTVVYGWYPGCTQKLIIPDDMCAKHTQQKKQQVDSLFRQNFHYIINPTRK